MLSLADNDISSVLPNGGSVSYLLSLQELNLSNNALAGRLPPALYRLPSLAVLGLTNNYLIGDLAALEGVDLSAN